jgi:hypothetical protein
MSWTRPWRPLCTNKTPDKRNDHLAASVRMNWKREEGNKPFSLNGSKRDMRRWEHYREWLTTHTVLDSMYKDDLHTIGRSDIPTCDKCAGHPGYLQFNNSNQGNNVTPGPSCSNKGQENCSNSNHHGSEWNSSHSRKLSHKHHGKKKIPRNELSDSDDSSPLDDDYFPNKDNFELSSDELRSTRCNNCAHKLKKEKQCWHSKKNNCNPKWHQTNDKDHSDPSNSSSSNDRQLNRLSNSHHDKETHWDRESQHYNSHSTQSLWNSQEKSWLS